MRKIIVFCLVLCLLPLVVCAGWYYAGVATIDYTADGNCMGAWYMNGGLSANGDNETDRSGEDGTLTETSGDIPNSATVPSGYSGNSRDFERGDGDSEYLTHANAGSTDISGENQPLSIVAWIKPENVIDTEDYYIVAKYSAGNDNRQYNILVNATAAGEYKITAKISGIGTAVTTKSVDSTTTDYAQGVWCHVAVVYNDTDLRVYVNGSLNCTPLTTSVGIFNSSAAFVVGATINNGTPEGYFDGLIDDVGVFDRELTSSEIANIYASGIDGDKGGND